MRIQISGVLVSTILFTACSSTPPKPYYNQNVLVVDNGWSKYWAMDLAMLHKNGGPPDPGGCFRYEGIIDSNGHVFDGRLLAFSGPPTMVDWVNNVFALQHFKPTATNIDHAPVKAVFEMTFFNHVHSDAPIGTEVPPTAGQAAVIQHCIADMDKQLGSAKVSAPATASLL